jgi:hypothetical protein
LLLVSIGYLLGYGWLLWAACAGYFAVLFLAIKIPLTRIQSANLFAEHRDLLALLVFIVIAITVTFIFSRANIDDGYYLNAVVSALDHSELPILHFDGMHDDLTRPNHLITQKRQTYEILVATISAVTGLTAWVVYYLCAPAFFAIFIGIANWLLLKRFAGEYTWQALLATLAILLVWDAGGRSFGLWSFTMLYPGKVVMLTVLIPLIVHFTLELISRQNLRSWALLVLAQCAALSFSSSGAYAGALASGFVLLASLDISKRSFVMICLVGSALLANVGILLVNWLDIQSIGGLGSEGLPYSPAVLFGTSFRGVSAFLLLLCVPLFALLTENKWSGWLCRYLAIAILLIFNPLVIQMLGALAKLLTWRSGWALPVPALIALGLVFAKNSYTRNSGLNTAKISLAMPLLAALLAAVFIFSDKPTIAGKGIFINLGQPKVHPLPLSIARHINSISGEDDLVLVPYKIAPALAGLRHAPHQVAVRPIYIDHMGTNFTPDDAAARKEMQEFVTNGPADPNQWQRIFIEIINRNVDVVVIVRDPDGSFVDFEDALRTAGYSIEQFDIVDIWVRT